MKESAGNRKTRRVTEAANVVVFDQVAKVFPNDRAVNKALRGLLRSGAQLSVQHGRAASGAPVNGALDFMKCRWYILPISVEIIQ